MGDCFVWFGSLLVFGFVSAIIAYIVFGIMYLIDAKPIANQCADLKLWTYVLISVILSFLRLNNSSNLSKGFTEDSHRIYCTLICFGFIELSFATWGGVELYENTICEELRNSHLWKFGYVTFILQLIFGIIFTIIPFIFITCLMKYDTKKPTNQTQLLSGTGSIIDSPLSVSDEHGQQL